MKVPSQGTQHKAVKIANILNGGIDLSSSKLSVDSDSPAGLLPSGFNRAYDLPSLEYLRNISGLVPDLVDFKPHVSIREFLGVNAV